MAPHLTNEKLDVIQEKTCLRWTRSAIHQAVVDMRVARGVEPPQIWAIRRAMKGCTHRRAPVETRGRKSSLTDKEVQRLERTRQNLVRKADGEYEVTYAALMKAARVSVRSASGRWPAVPLQCPHSARSVPATVPF